MPPPLLVNMDQVDVEGVYLNREQIYSTLPQAHEFQLLDRICMFDKKNLQMVACANIREDAWWVRGHVPGKPLLPGVLMLEMAAQTSAVLAKLVDENDSFIGFGGIDQCKFREAVIPPSQLYILCVAHELKPRRIISNTQGIVNGKMVFEARITGMTMK